MYRIGAVLENGHSEVALLDDADKCLATHNGGLADLAELCRTVLSKSDLSPSDVAYVGIATDACCTRTEELARGVKEALGIRCHVAPLLCARALGEAYAANDVPSLITLRVENTIECGIVIDKRLYGSMPASIAHMVIHVGGYECTCGRRGCFEAYASLSGLRRIAAESGIANAEELTHQAMFAMHSPNAEQAKQRYVKHLASGITNVINLFQPNELVLEGPFTEVGDELMNPMMDLILREQYSHSMPNKCKIRIADKATDAAPLGAALLGRWSGV